MGVKILTQNTFFTVDSELNTRGHPFKLKKIRVNTVRHISTFSYCTVNDFNSLPSSVVLSNSVNCFTSKLNDAWKEHPLKFDADCFWFSCGQIPILLRLFIGRGGVMQAIDLLSLNKGEQCEQDMHIKLLHWGVSG